MIINSINLYTFCLIYLWLFNDLTTASLSKQPQFANGGKMFPASLFIRIYQPYFFSLSHFRPLLLTRTLQFARSIKSPADFTHSTPTAICPLNGSSRG